MADELDELLSASVVQLVEPDELAEEVRALVGATRDVRRTRRRRRRIVVAGVTSVVVLAGGAAAAAGSGGWTSPWADQPVTSIRYTLPSGGVCEQRIGDLHLADHRAQVMIQHWLSAHPLTDIIDIDSAVKDIRSGPNSWDQGDGTSIPVGYGTDHYDADYEYDTAVWTAIGAAVINKLEDEGFTIEKTGPNWAAETHCTGSNPHPNVPPWQK